MNDALLVPSASSAIDKIHSAASSVQQPFRIAFDLFVLGQGIKTGVYRVCEELFPRLATQPGFLPRAILSTPRFATQSQDYLAVKGLDWPWINALPTRPSCETDVLLSPFFAPWEPWASDERVLKVFIAHDLTGLLMPEYVEQAMHDLLQDIYGKIDQDTLIFSISQQTKKDLLAWRPDLAPEQIVVIPLAAGVQFHPCTEDERLAAVRKKYGIPSGVPYILSLATLEIRKNLHTVVQAFARLMEEEPESSACLVLAGMRGWKLRELNRSLDELGPLRNRVILTGFVAEEDLASLYSGAACFAYMSFYEGFGLPPLEAMACGTPVLCANTSSLPEVMGNAGILLEPEDTEGLCAAMRRLLADPTQREELRGKGLARARLFNWDECAAMMAKAIRRRLAERAKLSIITICRNEKHIEDTCRSVVGQTWQDFEWIVVDGASTDGTLDILRRYQEHIRVLISEKDHGRYDAMNKGIAQARGEYLLFLNGGDYLAHARVLENIFTYQPLPGLEKYTSLSFDADILYGEVLAKETGMMPWPIWTVGPQQFSLEYFANHSLPHQATFIRRYLFEEYGLFDITYRFSADYEWFMRVLLRHGVSSAYLPMPVSVYNFEGASSGGVEGHEPHMQETQRVYAEYATRQDESLQLSLLLRKKWRQYLPEWLKRLLRPVWNRIKKMLSAHHTQQPSINIKKIDVETPLYVPPGHYFSPIVNTKELKDLGLPRVRRHENTSIPGIAIDLRAMSELWQHLLPHITTCPFPEKDDGSAYSLENNAFVYADGLVLQAMLRHFKPKRIIEVGSGFSSACMLETSRRLLDDSVLFSFIEPYPALLQERLKLCQSGHVTVIPQKIQSVELSFFEQLESSDILFIDSTHVVKTGSDVVYELFEILPALRPGVIVHFHDIFWPFEYPEEWIFNENRSWNECYTIRAFLTNNFEYEILFWGSYWASIMSPEDKLKVPLFIKNSGGSLWLRKREAPSKPH